MIFVDTTFWVGSADSNDDFHPSASLLISALRMGKTPVALTTDFVLDEVVTILGRRRGFGAEKAAEVAELLLSSPRVFTVYIDDALMKESLELYPEFRGRLSLTDVSSVVVMRKYGVKQIFSHDGDFDGVKGLHRSETAS